MSAVEICGIVLLFSAAWISCAVLSAGFAIGHGRVAYPSVYETVSDARRELITNLMIGMAFGPVSLFASLMTYGWSRFSLSAAPIPDWFERSRGRRASP